MALGLAQVIGGASQSTLAAWRHGLWWFHGLLAITLVASIPYTKAAHMLTRHASMLLRDPQAGKRLRAIPPEREEEPAGYGVLADFSALHLLQLDACTRCGRCHEVCPANTVGLPLSPRDVVLELGERLSRRNVEAGFQRGHTGVSAFWVLLGLGLLYAGLRRRSQPLRLAGFALFGISLAKIFLYDLSSLSSVTRALSFLAVGGVLLAAGFFYQRLTAAEHA